MFSFNPFYKVFETSQHPHARTLRTGLWQKLEDAFSVLIGEDESFKDKEKPYYAGVFDYLTLMIPQLALRAFSWADKHCHESWLATIAWLPLLVINIPLVIARYVFGAVAMFPTAIITGIVHLFAQIPAKPLKEDIHKLTVEIEVEEVRNGWKISSTQKNLLGKFLEGKNVTLEKVALSTLIPVTTDGPNKEMTLNFHINSEEELHFFSIKVSAAAANEVNKASKDNFTLFKSLLALNVAGVSTVTFDATINNRQSQITCDQWIQSQGLQLN